MLQHVTFCSQFIAEQFAPTRKMACISITSPGKPDAVLKSGWGALLRIAFHDIGPDALGQKPFSREQAHQLREFIHQLAPDIAHLVVHCHAGLSRSPAVARYVAKHYKLAFPANCRTYNRWVFQLLSEPEK